MDIEFPHGCTVDFPIEQNMNVDSTHAVETVLAFTIHATGPACHVHLRLPSASLRHKWMVAVQVAAGSPGRHSCFHLSHFLGIIPYLCVLGIETADQAVLSKVHQLVQSIRMAHEVTATQLAR